MKWEIKTLTISHSKYEDLKNKISNKSCKIVVIGCGYVGAELCSALALNNFNYVSAYEISSDRIKQLREKLSLQQYENARFHISSDPTLIKFADIICICVPSPLSKSRLKPNMSYIDNAVKEINKFGIKNKLIILESTTSPFTTLDRILPKLEKANKLKVGDNFWLGFSPERIDPGNSVYTIENTVKIVSGVTEQCKILVDQFYSKITKTHVAENTQTAEMIKLYENTFRNVNIALVCELAQYCKSHGINVWDVIDGASTKEFGFMKFNPGLIGGHCIPLDIHYLTHHASQNGQKLHLSETAIAIHDSMPKHITSIIETAVGGKLVDKKILLVGVSYKPNVADSRESGAIDIYKLLKKKKAIIRYHDKYIDSLFLDNKLLHSLPLNTDSVGSVDCVVILQKHNYIIEEMLAEIYLDANSIVDCVNAYPQTSYYKREEKIFTL